MYTTTKVETNTPGSNPGTFSKILFYGNILASHAVSHSQLLAGCCAAIDSPQIRNEKDLMYPVGVHV